MSERADDHAFCRSAALADCANGMRRLTVETSTKTCSGASSTVVEAPVTSSTTFTRTAGRKSSFAADETLLEARRARGRTFHARSPHEARQ